MSQTERYALRFTKATVVTAKACSREDTLVGFKKIIERGSIHDCDSSLSLQVYKSS